MEYLVFLGFVVQQFGLFAYLRDTLRGKTQPNRIAFFLWALVPMIGVAAALSEGVTFAALPVFAAGFGPLLVFLASFVNKKAYWKISRFDWACGALSVLAVILWQMTNNPDLAIAFAVLADFSAALPVIKKCWTHPHSETSIFYLTAVFNQSTAFLAMKDFSFTEVAFPLYLLSICVAFYAIITIRKRITPLEVL